MVRPACLLFNIQQHEPAVTPYLYQAVVKHASEYGKGVTVPSTPYLREGTSQSRLVGNSHQMKWHERCWMLETLMETEYLHWPIFHVPSKLNCEFLLAFGVEALKRQSSRSVDNNDLGDLIAAEDEVSLENLRTVARQSVWFHNELMPLVR